MPNTVEAVRAGVASEAHSRIRPSEKKIAAGIQILGEANSILRTATWPNQMARNAERAATAPMGFRGLPS